MKPIHLLALVFLTLAVQCSTGDLNNGNEGAYESYRYPLWVGLIDLGYSVDFVGDQVDEGSYADYNGLPFDPDHAGIGGIETSGVLERLNEIVAVTATPNIILLGIGGNDLTDGQQPVSTVIDNMELIIMELRASYPEVEFLVERIAPASESFMTAELNDTLQSFYQELESLVANLSTPQSEVVLVDMSTNFIEDYFADATHYNQEGAIFVANQYKDAIVQLIPIPQPVILLPIGDSRVEGARY